MKRAKFLLAFGMWVCLTSGVLRAEGTPKILFDKTVFDFGKTSQVQSVTGTFTFTNTGDGILKLDKPVTSCGCTVAALKTNILEPGQKGELGFTLNMGTARASLVKHITVGSNDPQNPKVELTVKADYVPLFEVVPTMLRLDIRQGAETNLFVQFKRTDGKKLSVAKTETSKPWITAKAEPADKSDETATRIQISVKPDGAPRQLSENVRIFTEDTNQPSASIFVYGRVLGDIALSPDSAYFSVSDPEFLKKENAQLFSTRKLIATSTVPGKSFELHNPTSSIKELNVELVPKEKGRYEIIAKLTEAPKESVRGTISIESDVPTQPKVEVPVTINVNMIKKN